MREDWVEWGSHAKWLGQIALGTANLIATVPLGTSTEELEQK